MYSSLVRHNISWSDVINKPNLNLEIKKFSFWRSVSVFWTNNSWSLLGVCTQVPNPCKNVIRSSSPKGSSAGQPTEKVAHLWEPSADEYANAYVGTFWRRVRERITPSWLRAVGLQPPRPKLQYGQRSYPHSHQSGVGYLSSRATNLLQEALGSATPLWVSSLVNKLNKQQSLRHMAFREMD
jgi:hypothetical protein